MTKPKITRGRLLAAAAPLAAAPLVGKLVLGGDAAASGHRMLSSHEHADMAMGHAAMIGPGVPAVGGPRDLDALLHPPPAFVPAN